MSPEGQFLVSPNNRALLHRGDGRHKEGLYSTASEVVREALRCMRERDEDRLVMIGSVP